MKKKKKNSEETTIEKQLVPFRWSTKQYITTLRVVFMKLLNFGFFTISHTAASVFAKILRATANIYAAYIVTTHTSDFRIRD